MTLFITIVAAVMVAAFFMRTPGALRTFLFWFLVPMVLIWGSAFISVLMKGGFE